jgi:hypothetical protein
MEEEEEAKRQRFDTLTSLKNLSKKEYREMRKRISYELPMTSTNSLFWRREQQVIMKKHYGTLKKYSVAWQHVLDFGHMTKHAYFKEALRVSEKLGVVPLMKIKEDYNIKLVQQFFATLVFGNKNEVEFKWITGDTRCESNFVLFHNL